MNMKLFMEAVLYILILFIVIAGWKLAKASEKESVSAKLQTKHLIYDATILIALCVVVTCLHFEVY